VRLYGPRVGYSSFCVVTRGFKQALESSGSLSGFMPTDAYDEYGHYAGVEDFGGVVCGQPQAMFWLMNRGKHQYRTFMLAPNSSWVPLAVMKWAVDACTEILTPSKWGKSMIEGNFGELTPFPVRVVPHGVSPAFCEAVEAPDGPFTVLHMASTGLDRKSTLKLVKAFSTWSHRKDARLMLVLEAVSKNIVQTSILEENGWKMPEDIVILSRLNASPDVLKKLYSSVHVVCQPSRAEGFGLVPLEAMACGVPAVLTNCTGHTEYLDTILKECFVQVEHGPNAYTDDGPSQSGAECPTVEVDSIRASLDKAFDGFNQLKTNSVVFSSVVRRTWSWENQLSAWIKHVEKLQGKSL
jgi:glycosyltransferase involved in cell wall biosynthesis